MNSSEESGGRRRGPAWAVVSARMRVLLVVAGVLVLVADGLLDRAGVDVPGPAAAGLVLVVVGLALYVRMGTVRADPVLIDPPVRGRWVAVNSPADRVPSHGVHAYGQSYAVDLVHVPDGPWSPATGWRAPHSRPPGQYPGFGRPVVSPVDGVVVRVRDGRRDHDARTSVPGVLVMVAEGAWLEVTGRILGNHVVVRCAGEPEPTYVLMAHLQRGSIGVAVGDEVCRGQPLGECGNSGNTSEPHVHLQVMDRARASVAAGLPFAFSGTSADDGTPLSLPRTGQAITAPEATSRPSASPWSASTGGGPTGRHAHACGGTGQRRGDTGHHGRG